MQRYSMTKSGICDFMYKDDNGKWVLFEEAENELAEARQQPTAYHKSIYCKNCEANSRLLTRATTAEARAERYRAALERIASNEADDGMRECIRQGISYHRILEDITHEALKEGEE